MRIVVAPDSFKESLSAAEACTAIVEGLRRVVPEADIVCVPMADGGEGTVDALVAATQGRTVTVDVSGPLGERVDAVYGVLGDGTTAVIEMAAASGLALVPAERRDPRVTTTRGTGELMAHALDAGVTRMIIGLGGSATNDAGAGMAQALGYSLVDARGDELPPGGAALAQLGRIDPSARHPKLDGCEVLVACDVSNPLCGPQGASRVYGPQKGASEAVALELDAALRHFGEVAEAQLGVSVLELSGAGAAGGLGAGLVAFAGGELRRGVALVADACGLRDHVRGADLVITGEGRLDGQSVHGKTPVGVAHIARELGVPAVALAGSLGDDYRAVFDHGIEAAFAVTPESMALGEALAQAASLLADAAETTMHWWRTKDAPEHT